MSGKWHKKEPVSPEEAQALAERLITDEARDELESSIFSVSDLVKVSLRAGVILHDDEPCAIVGVTQSGLMQTLWFLPLKGLRGKVREFIRYMRSLEHAGPIWAEATDKRARLIRIGGGRKDGSFWRLR